MFKKNVKHTQTYLFGLFNSLPERMKKKIEKSEEYTFYKLIFSSIKEDIFAGLYSEVKSRPNAPINAMVSSLILMHRYKWSYEELFKHVEFNILTKIALGLDSIESMPFCPATLFNFQNRLSKHFA
ncbi:MAG: transposase [Spirochaetota bacterium]